MTRTRSFSVGLGLLAVVVMLLAVLAAGLVFPAVAAPLAQGGDFLPTPTIAPVEDVPYTLTTVGKTAETLTFTHPDKDGITFGDTIFTSDYPAGMTFSINPTSANGPIESVWLFMLEVPGSQVRFFAEWNSEQQAWIIRPGSGDTEWKFPPLIPFDFMWEVTDSAGTVVQTDPITVTYSDPDYDWFRSESAGLVLIWRGFGEDNPDAIAQTMANTIAGLDGRFIEGVGETLSYQPMAVVFPDDEALGIAGYLGLARSDVGVTISVLPGAEVPKGQENCPYVTPADQRTMDWRISGIYEGVVYQLMHLYQEDQLGGQLGPDWWRNGEKAWFSNTSRPYDLRLRNLAALQDLPPLSTSISVEFNQTDGCSGLADDVGASFLNFLVANYGGLEVHRAITEQMLTQTDSVFSAVEDQVGKPFMEIENEWRAYLGFRPLTPADLDPALALEPYEDSMIAVGDSVTLPAMPMTAQMYDNPAPKALLIGTCFGNTPVEILRMGQLDGVAYFEVDCMGQVGWMTRDQLIAP